MDKLSKDELMLIAIELNLPDMLALCKTSIRIKDKIYKQDAIWYYKLYKSKEFSIDNIEKLKQGTPKETYMLLYELKQLQHNIPILKTYSLFELYI